MGDSRRGSRRTKETEKETMKKGWIIALCVLLVLLAGAGFGYYRLYTTAQEAEAAQRTLYEQYQTMLQNAEQTTLTVTENGETVGVYTLDALGLLDATKQTIAAGFTADERMNPDIFDQKGVTEKLEWRAQTHTQPGTVRADLVRYTDERVVDDLEAMSRRRAQDAYMEFDGEKFRVVDEVQGNELELEPVRAALREAAAALTVDASAPQSVSFEVTDVSGCYAQPEITAKNADFDFNELLQEKLADVSVKLDFNLEGQTEQSKIVTLTQKELLPLVSVKKDGSIQVDEDKLDVLIAGWKALADVSNTSFILNTYVDGPKPMGFLKVDYQLDTESLKQTLTEALTTLTFDDIRAQLLLYKNGEPYEPLTDVYVEVDIDNQKLTVYKEGEVVISTDVVTGNLNGFQTITGLYYTYYKATDIWLDGPDYHVFVKYWVSMTDLYGLHDASWRTNFGGDYYLYAGSHGCVNTPEDAMKTIYDNVTDGIPILSYHHERPVQEEPEETTDAQEALE